MNFEFDATAPISDQVAQVLDAGAAGAVAPDGGRVIIDSTNSLAAVRASEQLERGGSILLAALGLRSPTPAI